MKKITILLFQFCFITIISAQSDSTCELRISLLTCSPGEELYTTWGHSALRIQNSSTHTDLIYNYGTFDFDDPSFYSKFTRGKLLYFVSVDSFENFVYEYKFFHRGIIEQVLNLSCAEKEKLQTALNENAREQNKYYKYDFILDNCTTRLRDIVFKNANGSVQTENILPKKDVTFRNLIHDYLDRSKHWWTKLGIDILLGAPVDKKVSNEEAMFLPDYLLKGFDSTRYDGSKLVKEKSEILQPSPQSNDASWFSPFLAFTVIFLLIAMLTLLKDANKFLSVFDFFLFFTTGVLGVFLLFMWLGTDHPECRNNFNLAWAFPVHFIVVFFLYRRLNWTRYYFLGNSILLILLLFFWKWLPQEMNPALIPVACLLLLRSFMRYKNSKA